MGYRSVAEMFCSRVTSTPDAEAFSYPDAKETWQKTTWGQVGARVRKLASGLKALGLTDEDRVSILSGTRVEWLFADLAIMCAGGATTTIYPNSTADECQYILQDSGSVLCFAEDDGQIAKLVGQRDSLPQLKHVVVIDGKASADGWVITLADLEAKGATYDAEHPGDYDAVIGRITPERLATLIYTSGTTGRPKGVELLHDCWLYTGEALEGMDILGPTDKQFLWLPLSHSFGKVLETIAVHLGVPTAVDGRIPKIIDNLAVVQPTFMAAAPRIFEKVYNKVIAGAKEAGGLKLKIFTWAMSVGREVSRLKQAGKEPAGLLGLKYSIADKLVFSKLRARFGGRIRFFISGSAPLNRDIAEFFHAAGLLILEGYGLTESSAASFVNPPSANKFGTVGPILPGGEVRIDPETGEIQFKSRGVMRGYYNLDEATKEALGDDGWLRTGDKGELDNEGYLRITDRIKNLIKTSGGKYVAPQAIEGQFKALCPLVSQMLVHGDRRNFCSALITMDEESMKPWAAEHGLSELSYADLSKHEKVIAEFQRAVDQLNTKLARFETIKKFQLLPKDFTVEDGELTASLKVKRKVVEQKYMHILDGFYTDAFAQM